MYLVDGKKKGHSEVGIYMVDGSALFPWESMGYKHYHSPKYCVTASFPSLSLPVLRTLSLLTWQMEGCSLSSSFWCNRRLLAVVPLGAKE